VIQYGNEIHENHAENVEQNKAKNIHFERCFMKSSTTHVFTADSFCKWSSDLVFSNSNEKTNTEEEVRIEFQPDMLIDIAGWFLGQMRGAISRSSPLRLAITKEVAATFAEYDSDEMWIDHLSDDDLCAMRNMCLQEIQSRADATAEAMGEVLENHRP
jgi:hypothetical protein